MKHRLKSYAAPHNRLRTCLIMAVGLHLVLLISIQKPPAVPMPVQQPIHLVMLPQKTSGSASAESDLLAKDVEMASQTQNNPIALDGKDDFILKKTISAYSHDPQDVQYLSAWQSKVEAIGNRYYANMSSDPNLKGNVRVLVSINKDGSLREAQIRQSSGYNSLDEVALTIVQLSAPFEPLPSEIGQHIEVLEIIRTWQFNGPLALTG